MTIKTSKRKTYQVQWIDTSILKPNVLVMQMTDPRGLAKIASEFDGLTSINRQDKDQGDKAFEGYSTLTLIKRIGDDVQIQMEATV